MGMKMKKLDAWVVLRFDSGTEHCRDRIAVKGVFNSQEAASKSIEATSDQSGVKSTYTVIRTRRFAESDAPASEKTTLNRVQGFSTLHWRPGVHSDHPIPGIEEVRKLWNELPTRVRKRTLHPLLSYLTENAVAVSLGASVEDEAKTQWDLVLPDGARVDVKTVILDISSSKSPVVQVNSRAQIQFLALVIFRPDLTIDAAKMFPAEALSVFGRPGPRSSRGDLINVRITPHLLHYSEAWNIPLGHHVIPESE